MPVILLLSNWSYKLSISEESKHEKLVWGPNTFPHFDTCICHFTLPRLYLSFDIRHGVISIKYNQNLKSKSKTKKFARLEFVILALVVGFFELLMKDVGAEAAAAAHNEWTEDALSEHFSLGTFVPLSEVKHTAPPGWVSRAHCTLPPRPITGKAETIKLRSSGSGLSERPRPRSSHLSPYRGMQVTPTQNQVMYKTAKTSSRSGSMSPTSASPTR